MQQRRASFSTSSSNLWLQPSCLLLPGGLYILHFPISTEAKKKCSSIEGSLNKHLKEPLATLHFLMTAIITSQIMESKHYETDVSLESRPVLEYRANRTQLMSCLPVLPAPCINPVHKTQSLLSAILLANESLHLHQKPNWNARHLEISSNERISEIIQPSSHKDTEGK